MPQQPRPVPIQPQQPRPIAVQPQQPIVTQQRPRLTHIIPLANMETNSRRKNYRLFQIAYSLISAQQFSRRPFLVSSSTPSFNTNQQQQFNTNAQCFDREPMNRCTTWLQFCQTSTFMQTSCRRSCRLC